MATIKGYLPVRVRLPFFVDESEEDETFFYVKEHQQKEDPTAVKDTLFVTNAPVVTGIRTRILLNALLGRFGDVKRVTVIENPQQKQSAVGPGGSEEVAEQYLQSWTKHWKAPTYLAPSLMEGSFAHVVFTSNKEMKRAMKALQKLMSKEGDELPAIVLDPIELQTLRDASDPSWDDEHDVEEERDDKLEKKSKRQSGLAAVLQRYRSQCYQMSRAALLEECNAVMQEYEDAEEKARNARAQASNTPDDDGFVTVSYSSQVGGKAELEQDATAGASGSERRRKGQKRNRKKKQGAGASELPDFYRFQTKVNRKRTVQELRERFEEDLAKLKRMKDEKQFKPF